MPKSSDNPVLKIVNKQINNNNIFKFLILSSLSLGSITEVKYTAKIAKFNLLKKKFDQSVNQSKKLGSVELLDSDELDEPDDSDGSEGSEGSGSSNLNLVAIFL